MRKSLFVKSEFVSHSGLTLNWKIECDALTDEDLQTLASFVNENYDFLSFTKVVGIPSGGIRFAKELEKYVKKEGNVLIVDDVLTTGKSMKKMHEIYPDAVGLVIFCRGHCPDWVTPIFQLII